MDPRARLCGVCVSVQDMEKDGVAPNEGTFIALFDVYKDTFEPNAVPAIKARLEAVRLVVQCVCVCVCTSCCCVLWEPTDACLKRVSPACELACICFCCMCALVRC